MKKTLTLLLLTAMLTAPLAGCSDTDDTPAKTTEGADNGTDTLPEYNAAEANPASDFEYEVNDDGGITITKYIGTDTDVVIPEKIEGKDVTVIGEGAFNQNKTVVSVVMSDGITLISAKAFYGCSQLSTVVLSKHLDRIQDNVFENCTNLSNITLPEQLTFIGAYAFANCKSLKHIAIPSGCFHTIMGGLAYEPTQNVFAYSGLETIELSEGIEFIPPSAFYGSNIKEIVIPGTVIEIREYAFADCEKLESVTIKEGVRAIWDYVFRNTSISNIVLPQTIENFRINAVNEANSLTGVYFEGNTPNYFIVENNQGENAPFTVYYHEGAEGFTTPEWNGYKTEIW